MRTESNGQLTRASNVWSRCRRAGVVLAASLVALPLVLDQAAGATLSVVGGTSQFLPATFNPGGSTPGDIGAGSSIKVFNKQNASSGGLYVNPAGPVTLRFTMVGTEASDPSAAFSKLSWWNTDLLFTNYSTAGTSVERTFDTTSGDGLVPFIFLTLSGILPLPRTAENGGPIHQSLAMAFSQVFASDMAGKLFNTVYAFFDDAKGDRDFDDMVVEISVVPVPVPPALILFGSGLLTLGLLARRRKQTAGAGRSH